MTKRFCRRPWGWWITILDRKRFKVKLLRFNMRDSLSWQMHDKRDELWLFLTGGGCFKHCEKEARRIDAGEYKLVLAGEYHQFYPWDKSLILEIQYGEYCDEEDIVRV